MTRIVLRGRGEAMSRALTALRHTNRTGQGAVLVISGEPGIGKSALLREIAEQAARAGFRVGGGKADEGDQIASGAPLLVALRSGPQPLFSGEAFESLAALYDKPLWLIDRVGALLEELAEHSPVLISVDDVQWADRLTRFALRALAARLSGSPVVWVVAGRRGVGRALEDIVDGADDVTHLTRIALGPLSAVDLAELAADRLNHRPSARLLALLDETGGNPFWAVQVIEGLTRRAGRQQEATDLYAELGLRVRDRLRQLTGGAAALVQLAAVWGRPLSAADAATILGDTSEAQIAALAREAEDHGLLAGDGHEVYFPHDLFRAAVYADITSEDRRSLHRACALHLVGGGGSVLSAAGHFRASAVRGDREAILALDQAARDSESLPDQAAEIAAHAFALTSEGHPLWFLTGEHTVGALLRAQREGEALTLVNRLRARAVEPEIVAGLELLACRALWCAGDCVEMERRATAALTLGDVSQALRARLASAQALAASRRQAGADVEVMARRALGEAKRLGDIEAQRLAVVASIEAARNEGRHRLALERFTELRQVSDDAYLAEEIRTLQHLDRFDEAEAMLAKIRDAADDVDRQLPSMLYAQMWQDLSLAQFDAAEAGARTLLRLADETGNHAYRLNARTVLAAVSVHRGETGRAAELLDPAGDTGRTRRQRSPRLRLMQGWLKAATGDHDGALTLLVPLLDAAGEFRDPWPWSPPWMRILAGIGLSAGDPVFAARAARIAELAAQRNPGVASLQGAAAQVRGLLDGDVGTVAGAVQVLRDSPRPMLLADALRDLGSLQLVQARPEDGVRALTEAAEIYRRVGAVSGSRSVAGLLRRHGVSDVRITSAVSRPSTGWAALTPTEMRVVALIGAGHTNRSAASELGVSPNTVNTHLRSVFRKLDVRSRVQLTIALREQPGLAERLG
ncbi:helix-turn-helix transcriptional regulator [Mycolicibacterium vaccae]|uniref:Regulatory protein LuxR n=1 Tax=Mycolicibacterium vaccae ATCC 25954 TaxID=1194972 RepID=K0UYV3_MYCVA|nr:AAA family ATPase [Mycolicibacterium vaccae]ANI39044.1 regulatory protein LuxR [Mycolicibacterium vaccae 95051]EJZ12322.1 regulatory protein LuxR [Mycolicibacterium vaccae ATCC 25954]MCV7064261.1 AAA family ATPase [Mycolicibacterium vaccae]